MIINIIPKPKGPFSLKEISDEANCTYNGNKGYISICNITPIDSAKKGDLSFLDNSKYIKSLEFCEASAVIVSNKISNKLNTEAVLLKSDNVYASYAKALLKFYPKEDAKKLDAKKINVLNPESIISSKAHISNNVEINSNTIIESHSTIGPNVVIGESCFISSNVRISNTIIGNNTVVHSGTVIGSDGFGFAPLNNKFIKIPQIGIVKIGNNVEIGANCSIDKGSLNHTEIRDGVKIDNLVHIAHNVIIKENTVIAGQTGIAGSTKIGRNVMIGGQVGIAGHLKIGDNVKIGAQAGVTKDLKNNVTVSGTPAVNLNTYLKKTVMLNKMVERNE